MTMNVKGHKFVAVCYPMMSYWPVGHRRISFCILLKFQLSGLLVIRYCHQTENQVQKSK